MLKVKVINLSDNPLPEYQTEGSAGMDIRASLEAVVEFAPLERKLIPTGLYIELPLGYEAQIRPRSGLAMKKGLTLPNSPATIDSDYRGELKIPMVNLSNEVQRVSPGDRIAQMIVAAHEIVYWRPVEELVGTERGEGGFGHTGDS